MSALLPAPLSLLLLLLLLLVPLVLLLLAAALLMRVLLAMTAAFPPAIAMQGKRAPVRDAGLGHSM
ncbi:hypothetical protein BX592_115137 [Paraburkholderia rhizosphaerae]|uniref:Uncharacterized protein n=2 Tax=Paraburkholderia rhizosphaerae TaxID=480658 RepID=A0A4R8LNE9_9BURK|nr:hypothetical protein BX592_115137 [Paraburkholderia rhizosphaerae]